MTYLLLNLRSSIRSRSPIPLALSAAAATTAGVYGTEYFVRQPRELADLTDGDEDE